MPGIELSGTRVPWTTAAGLVTETDVPIRAMPRLPWQSVSLAHMGFRPSEAGMDAGTVTSVVPVRTKRRGTTVADRGRPSTLPRRGGLRMSSPIVAQSEPYGVELEAGRNYAWCACGRSANQPWCDGSHRDTEFSPIVWKAEKTEAVFLCGCKSTSDSPYCDGTHNLL